MSIDTMPTRVRRSAHLWLDLDEQLALDPITLLQGRSGLRAQQRWRAWLPATQQQVVLDDEDLAALAGFSEVIWTELADIEPQRTSRVRRLLQLGVLVAEDGSAVAAADSRLRAGYWHPISALTHAFGRWEGQHHGEDGRLNRYASVADMIAVEGPPPPASPQIPSVGAPVALPGLRGSVLEPILATRHTARNFDRTRSLPLLALADLLGASLAVRGVDESAPGATVYKKAVPSGGALHPIEAFLLVQQVEGLTSGLYHYDAVAHQLRPLPSDSDLQPLAQAAVAGQPWFANVHVQVILVARFQRNFWKYRRHAKAYRAVVLECGHLSQMLYLRAAELGVGAFVTAAINELELERALGLDPLECSPLCVCGFGPSQSLSIEAGGTRELRPQWLDVGALRMTPPPV